jgi:hypothetical protein
MNGQLHVSAVLLPMKYLRVSIQYSLVIEDNDFAERLAVVAHSYLEVRWLVSLSRAVRDFTIIFIPSVKMPREYI